MTDQEFLEQHKHKIIEFRLGRKTRQALPVGDYFIIIAQADGYMLYGRHQRIPIIERPFDRIKDVYSLAQSLITHYGEYLSLLEDQKFAKRTFELVRYSVPQGEIFLKAKKFLNEVPETITNIDLHFAFDRPIC